MKGKKGLLEENSRSWSVIRGNLFAAIVLLNFLYLHVVGVAVLSSKVLHERGRLESSQSEQEGI